MNARRISQEYRNGVEEFLQFARENGKPIKGAYYCSCVCCLNQIRQEVGEIRDHLFIFGIVKSYTIWTWHGNIKKIVCPMGLEYKKIHACPNDCVLYTNDFATLKVCPTCGFLRFKKKTDGSSCEEEIEADSPQWKTIDETFPEFGAELRNLRIGLAIDDMNPYGNLSSKHSSWPILLVIYNLPHWLCMKRNRVEVFDAYQEEKFTLHAMLFCTINDFPTYGNLSRYSVKGHYACPICEENTSYTQLKHGQKIAYTRHH
uniref:Transposase-associated domain-containing protein n=1 Tax=Cajanus cajan TaxID=3821 RepID=A0A151R3L5_CAJCA|nr:hypothetical protein KK1_041692 [Cajanus cajan]